MIPWWFEVGALVVLLVILAVDVLLAFRRPHIPSNRESAVWIGAYIVLALVFAVVLWTIGDADQAGQFVAGWLTEYSLSIDNLFVFLLIMARFAVPRIYQQEILMVGIVISLVLRLVFILLGAQLIEAFSWIFYLFGAFLIITAARQAFGKEKDDADGGALTRWLRRRVRVSTEFEGARLRTVVDGRRVWTPALIVFIALGSTDLLFALDSIPAIFGITQDWFLVFSANVFALMGLRQLYFLLGDLVERLVYLKYGIAVVLAFIGVKLVLHALHENQLPFLNGGEGFAVPEVPTVLSLGVIVLAMGLAVVASLVKVRADRRRTDERAG